MIPSPVSGIPEDALLVEHAAFRFARQGGIGMLIALAAPHQSPPKQRQPD
jgi:hypothetical protein